jgi:hypothetical protein
VLRDIAEPDWSGQKRFFEGDRAGILLAFETAAPASSHGLLRIEPLQVDDSLDSN